MSTASRAVRPAFVPAEEPPAGFGDLVAAEWIKLWSLRSTRWLLAVIAVAVLAANANGAMTEAADFRSTAQSPDAYTAFRAIRAIFIDVAVLLVMLTAGSVGALAVVGEYATGTARTTFAAVPNRRAVVAAKAVVVTAVMLAYGALLVGVSFAVTQAILAGEGLDVTPGTAGVWRAMAASVLMAPVCALVGMAIGALVRGIGGTLMATAVLLILVPMVFDDESGWTAAVDHAQPVRAWDRLVMVGPAPGTGWSTAGFAQAWAVLGVWAVLAFTVAVAAVHRRDV